MELSCNCGSTAFRFPEPRPRCRIRCCCNDCWQKNLWAEWRGDAARRGRQRGALELAYLGVPFVAVDGAADRVRFNRLRDGAASTNCVSTCCGTLMMVDHPCYEARSVLVFPEEQAQLRLVGDGEGDGYGDGDGDGKSTKAYDAACKAELSCYVGYAKDLPPEDADAILCESVGAADGPIFFDTEELSTEHQALRDAHRALRTADFPPGAEGFTFATLMQHHDRGVATLGLQEGNFTPPFTGGPLLVDDEGARLCLKYAGYKYTSYARVAPGRCRWGDACTYSHAAPSVATATRLEQLHEEGVLRLDAHRRQASEAEAAKLCAPLPPWLHEARQFRVFRADATDAFSRMQESLHALLRLAVTDTPRKHTVVEEPGLQGLGLDALHECAALNEERVPACPTLAHAFRQSGRRFPRTWTMAYKATKSMVRRMHRMDPYVAFIAAYEDFVRDVIAPLAGRGVGVGVVVVGGGGGGGKRAGDGVDGGLRFQCPPTLRVHMPGRAPTIGMHCDSEYDNHEPGEINFWVPFTRVFDSNTLWAESAPGRGDFAPFELSVGQAVRFNGNQCRHFTKPNGTGKTRVSIDFRVIPRAVAVTPASFRGLIGDYPAKEI
jgi:hypothetical protein